jgi:hypothetical protein
LEDPLINFLTDLAACAEEQDDYGGFVVWGFRDVLAEREKPAFNVGTEESCEFRRIAWEEGEKIGLAFLATQSAFSEKATWSSPDGPVKGPL